MSKSNSPVHSSASQDAPHLRGLLDNDVLDVELVLVKAVDLGVGLGVLDQGEQELGRPVRFGSSAPVRPSPLAGYGEVHSKDSLDGPATLDDTVDLGLGGTADGTVVAAERNTLGVGLDVLKELDDLGEGETTARSGRLAGGREREPQVSRHLSDRDASGSPGTSTHRVFL